MLQNSQRIELGEIGLLNAPDPARPDQPLQQTAQNAADAYVDFEHHERIAVVMPHFEAHVGDADHFTAVDVDDLLIEQIALQAQHVLVRMIGVEFFVAELDAVEGDVRNLVVTDGKPGTAGADEVAIDAGGVNQGDDGGIANPPDTTMFQVVDRQAEEFREVEEIFRHDLAQARTRVPRAARWSDAAEKRKVRLITLYIRFGCLNPICPTPARLIKT